MNITELCVVCVVCAGVCCHVGRPPRGAHSFEWPCVVVVCAVCVGHSMCAVVQLLRLLLTVLSVMGRINNVSIQYCCV